MDSERFEKCLNKATFSMVIKAIIVFNIIIQVSLFKKYKKNLIVKLTKEKEKEKDLAINGTEDNNEEEVNEIDSYNLSQYTMTKFLLYDHFFFNSMSMFNHFKNKYFDISYLNYTYSNDYKKIKLEFIFGIYDKNKTLIHPSDFALYDEMTVLCFMKVAGTVIYSLPQIIENKYFECIEFFQIKEKPKFGLHFYPQEKKSYLTLEFHFYKFVNLEDKAHENDTIFSPRFISTEFNEMEEKTRNKKTHMNYLLRRNYIKNPKCDLKRNSVGDKKGWVFRNIYNNYFCYCIGGKCVKKEVKQICKLNFYKHVIDVNRDLYQKTHYIFVDFIFKALPSDDTFPVFEEMIKQNMSAHYITEKKELYNEYCSEKNIARP
jgi:hypothetical protein